MKEFLAAQAKGRAAAFAVIDEANAWSVATAGTFINAVGPFDQLVLGGN